MKVYADIEMFSTVLSGLQMLLQKGMVSFKNQDPTWVFWATYENSNSVRCLYVCNRVEPEVSELPI